MQSLTQQDSQRGDTLIEVMFAVAVFAMVAVGCISIMNQGVATAQRSLEVTLVRQQIDAQAETLRYIHQAYVAQYQKGVTPTAGPAAVWKEMTGDHHAELRASAFGVSGNTCPTFTGAQKPFILDAQKIQLKIPTVVASPGISLPPYSQVVYGPEGTYSQAYGIWIEAVPSAPDAPTGFIDFHIRACWDGPGSDAPMTLGTIVRLYEPR